MSLAHASPVRIIGRYALYGEIASGGMATVHVGRLLGPVGFTRTVAIKRLHPQFAKDPEFVSMFLDEARLAGRIQHPNVCPTLDVVATNGELFLVMEYLQGETLARLIRASKLKHQAIPPNIVVAILAGALYGLHAAHEARDQHGEPLHIVHRDISPQNILINRDGVAKILDFGVAKAAGRFHTTREGNVKGKLPYMSPEQLRGQPIDRRTDVYAAFVCAWEALAGRKLFNGDNEGTMLTSVLHDVIEPPSTIAKGVPPELDAIVMRGLARDASIRFATAKEAATALERAMRPALAAEVSEWVELIAGEALSRQAVRVAQIESGSGELPELSEILSGLTREMGDVPTDIGGPRASVTSAPSIVTQEDGALETASFRIDDVPAPPAPARRRPAVIVAAAAVIALLGVGAGVLLKTGGAPSAHPAIQSPPSSSVNVPPPIASVAPAVSVEAPSAPSATAVPAPTAPTSASAKPVGPAPPIGVKPPRIAPKTEGTVKPLVPPQTGCKPFSIGPNGDRIYNRDCPG